MSFSNRIRRKTIAALTVCSAFVVVAFVSIESTCAESEPTSGPATSPTALTLAAAHRDGAPVPAKLIGRDARLQLLATGHYPENRFADFSRDAVYATAPENIVRVDADGYVTPLADGQTTITATVAGKTATTSITVENFGNENQIDFANQVVPIFSKYGCNGGGCHGKSGGQNGFRLSLLGFNPHEDYEYIVKEGRGRRVFVPDPDHSLLLQKATGVLPHGGGARINRDSYDYRIMRRWIAQAMPFAPTETRTVTRIDVYPREQTMQPGTSQQLQVIATYSDNSTVDVTRSVQYESNEKEMAKVSLDGLVTTGERPGDASVMMRFSEQVAIFQAMIPLGAPIESLPTAKNFIDELVFAKLENMGLPPSEIADDATFHRRATIDIAGRLPSIDEVNTFLADTSPDKRAKWIETLLADDGYADNFAAKWSALLRNKRRANNQMRGSFAFHAWLRDSIYNNVSFDQIARQILTASGETGNNPAVVWYREVDKQEELVEDSAQVFLGQGLKCARCHHHPFEKWSQDDYYSYAAFFSRVGRKTGRQPGEQIIFHNRGNASANNPVTGKNLTPAPLDHEPLKLTADDDPRQHLAAWMVDKNNPFFAKMLVNRYWKHFLGRGLVEPEDDLRQTNPATNPQLLDAISKNFIESGYDLKQLVRTITNSNTYQLSSIPNKYNAVDTQNYSRFYPKRLPAEVLLTAVDNLTASRTDFAGLPPSFSALMLPDDSYTGQSYFLTTFGRPSMESACECERSSDASLTQSLHLLNSKHVVDKVSADNGRAATLAADANPDEGQKITELYLRAYARTATVEEIDYAKKYIEQIVARGKDDAEKVNLKRQAYEDIVWALLSTKEFLFNH